MFFTAQASHAHVRSCVPSTQLREGMRARASLLLLLCRASHAYEATADDDRTIPDGISCAAHEEIATFAAGCFWSVELPTSAGHKTVGSHLTFDQLLSLIHI